MPSVRFTGTMKVSGVNSTQGRQQNSFFFWLDDTASDAAGVVAAQAIAALCNGILTSVTKQVYSDPLGPFPSALLNGGSNRARLLFRNALRHTDNITLPYLRQDKSQTDIEAVFEGGVTGPAGVVFANVDGETLGDLVNIQATQVAETPGA